jgi:C-terminal processing protease CtpA/Prc
VAAFGLLSGVTRLIIDLRTGLGGTPETVAFLCGYLLGDEPVHLQDVVDRDGQARQFWSVPAANRLADDARIAVLTSSRTFSGCEELAYNLQALGRATIVGETTGGGAHPCEVFRLTDELEVTIPIARSRNAVTGTNWEQVGVVPDVACSADLSLEVARKEITGT